MRPQGPSRGRSPERLTSLLSGVIAAGLTFAASPTVFAQESSPQEQQTGPSAAASEASDEGFGVVPFGDSPTDTDAAPQRIDFGPPTDESLDSEDGDPSAEDGQIMSEEEMEAFLNSAEAQEAFAAFQAAQQELAEKMADMRATYLRYSNEVDQSETMKEKYREQRDVVRALLRKTLRAANVAMNYRDSDAGSYALTMVQVNNRGGIYDLDSFEASAKLLAMGATQKFVVQNALRSAIVVGDFDFARQILARLEGQALDPTDRNLAGPLDEIERDFNIEQQRASRDLEKTLPKVVFHTTNGDVTAELYIDEAPSAASHFISLVEDGYYEDAEFFQVVGDLIALCGHPDTDGVKKFLKDAHDSPDHRRALRGSMIMANLPIEDGDFFPNSASSRFAIMMLPAPAITQSQTVFGRVIDGMDVVSTFQRKDPSKKKDKGQLVLPADRIISAEILDRPAELPEPIYVNPIEGFFAGKSEPGETDSGESESGESNP